MLSLYTLDLISKNMNSKVSNNGQFKFQSESGHNSCVTKSTGSSVVDKHVE